jgi:hypothetical protein
MHIQGLLWDKHHIWDPVQFSVCNPHSMQQGERPGDLALWLLIQDSASLVLGPTRLLVVALATLV